MNNAAPEPTQQPECAHAVHLDTSIVLERFKRKNPLREQAKAVLSRYSIQTTSTYAKLEFKRGWLRDLFYLHEKSTKMHDMGELTEAIAKSFQGGQKNRLQRCIQAFSSYYERFPSNLSTGDQLRFFREQLRAGILHGHLQWSFGIDYEWDSTECIRSRVVPELSGTGKIKFVIHDCHRDTIVCRIHKFFEDNRATFQALADSIDSTSNPSQQLCDIAATIKHAMADTKYLCDNKVCVRLADALIAVDGLKVPTFAANNDSEWKLLAATLKKKLVNPLQTGN